MTANAVATPCPTMTERSGVERPAAAPTAAPLGYLTPHYEIRLCRGATGCPNALIDVRSVGELVREAVEASGWCEHLAERANRPLLLHQKFRAAVAGCPNACSEPQIRDFGVVGWTQPGTGERACNQCMECEAVCREGAIVVEDEPHIDRERCVDCGACVRACPSGTLVAAQTGYRVLGGGKLGRHPRLADTLLERTDAAGVRAAARAALGLMRQREARLGEILEREGPEPLCGALSNCPGSVGPKETQ